MIADLKPYPSIKDSGVLNRSVPNHRSGVSMGASMVNPPAPLSSPSLVPRILVGHVDLVSSLRAAVA